MKLSIIIALFNTEKFIEKCIRSIYENNNLNINEFEVIVINDGSFDKSQALVELLREEFKNLILINKDNGGQSSARNIGFDLAQGDYIYCLDSDDFINGKELIDALDYCYEEELDMLPIYFNVMSEDYILNKPSKDNYNDYVGCIRGGDFMKRFTISGTMWRYFYKTSIIKDNNLRLLEGVYHEDEEFVLRFLTYVERIGYQRHIVYNYIVRHNSTVNNKSKEHRVKLIKDIVFIIRTLKNHNEKRYKETGVNYEGLNLKIEQLLVSVFLRMKNEKFSLSDVNEIIDLMRESHIFPLIIKDQKFKFKFFSILLNSSVFRYLYFNK